MIIDVDFEHWAPSPVIRRSGSAYRRLPASRFIDKAAGLTPRQAVFYRNLIRMAENVRGTALPVDFEIPGGERQYLD